MISDLSIIYLLLRVESEEVAAYLLISTGETVEE